MSHTGASQDGQNRFSMSSRRAVRRALSLVVVLAIAAWAEPGLAMLPAAGQMAKCHTRMMHMHHQAGPAAMHKATSCCHQRVNSMPCCPEHPALPPAQCGSAQECCAVSSQPSRPLAFLVSGNPLLFQSNANGPAGANFVAPPQSSIFLLIADSPRFIRPVFDLKTDLRI